MTDRQQKLKNTFVTSIHIWTHSISNLAANGIKQQKIKLSAKNRKFRGTQTHQNWTIADWKNVAWSEESGFQLQHVDV